MNMQKLDNILKKIPTEKMNEATLISEEMESSATSGKEHQWMPKLLGENCWGLRYS